ncbi:hypothetical protein NEH83_34620 [Streptomyces sp. JUS-F4]|uniref:hypothetical protein n=1 Tax=Streptomyces sp. JUS-F4 TaxID=2951988 RepID=UPI002666BF5B|nr:hypothetical protein [Streptomyces sp. JUS-F4]WKN18871.1 hypothetical protein NEH83_34620 [Streptomyces sp. JUS-F4]
MTDYSCGSCSYGSTDLDQLQQHSHQTGHVAIREHDGILQADGVETTEGAHAVEKAEPTEGKPGKVRVAAEVGLGILAAATIGVMAWKNKELRSMAGGLLVELAESVAQNEYLKSASGAGTTLNSFRGR